MDEDFIKSLYAIADNRIFTANSKYGTISNQAIHSKLKSCESILRRPHNSSDTKYLKLEAKVNTLIMVDLYIGLHQRNYGPSLNSEFNSKIKGLCPMWPFC